MLQTEWPKKSSRQHLYKIEFESNKPVRGTMERTISIDIKQTKIGLKDSLNFWEIILTKNV